MKVRAKVGFGGPAVSMSVGQVGEITDKVVLADLLKAGYVEEVKEAKEATKEPAEKPKKKAVKA
jgi:hypothetical protein